MLCQGQGCGSTWHLQTRREKSPRFEQFPICLGGFRVFCSILINSQLSVAELLMCFLL